MVRPLPVPLTVPHLPQMMPQLYPHQSHRTSLPPPPLPAAQPRSHAAAQQPVAASTTSAVESPRTPPPPSLRIPRARRKVRLRFPCPRGPAHLLPVEAREPRDGARGRGGRGRGAARGGRGRPFDRHSQTGKTSVSLFSIRFRVLILFPAILTRRSTSPGVVTTAMPSSRPSRLPS